jgi:hypothetical protein
MAQGVAGRDGDIHGFRDQEECRVMRKVYAASGVVGIVKDVHSIKAHVYPRDQRCDQESQNGQSSSPRRIVLLLCAISSPCRLVVVPQHRVARIVLTQGFPPYPAHPQPQQHQ